MKLTEVRSSNVKAIGFDEAKQELIVEFRSGHTYVYKKADKKLYEGLVKADSIGQYMHENVYGRYDYEKIK